MQKDALLRVIEILGNQRALAKAVDVSPQAITKWLEKGVPAERVLDVERAVERQVTRQELRPDIYPSEETTNAA
jgi:DNA-binding transcriptional regulator YdaS (Cro superfamily)